MSGRVGSITTDIIEDGLVFNMDAANRASYIPNATTSFNTLDLSQSGSLQGVTNITPPTSASCWAFDGVDDYIDLSTTINLTENSTVLFWMKRKDASTGNDVPLGSTTYSWGYLFTILQGEPTTEAYARIGSNHVAFDNDSLNLPIGEWSQIGFTREGTTFKEYQDGVEKSEKTNASISGDTLFDRIFRAGGLYNYYVNGELSNLIGYNRALSSNEVLHNYNALKGRFGL